jgi:hypothetical protein
MLPTTPFGWLLLVVALVAVAVLLTWLTTPHGHGHFLPEALRTTTQDHVSPPERSPKELAGNVRVVMNGHGRDGHVWIDGRKVERLRAFEIKARCDELNEIVLHVYAEKIEVEGVFDVTTLGESIQKLKVVHYPDTDSHIDPFGTARD